MAPFNPELPRTNDPNYGNNSRAIDTPDGIRPQGVQQNQIMPEGQKIGDRSAEFQGQADAFRAQGEAIGNKAWGDLFSNIVQGADFLGKAGVQLVKKDIEDKVYEVASAERSAYTAELEKIKQGVGVGTILGGGETATNANGDPIPEAVSELSNTLVTLKSARDGGKITKTDYWGRLAAEAQNLRAQYPGFKAEIDAEFSKVTGQNPANARVNSLITEINRAAASSGSQQNKTLQFIKQNIEVPGANELLVEYMNGRKTDSEVIQQIGKYRQKYEQLRTQGLERADNQGTAEERQTRARTIADDFLGTAVSSSADKFAYKYGFGTAKDAEELHKMNMAGQISAPQWAARAQELNTEITRLRVDMLRGLQTNGVTKNFKDGSKTANELVENALQPLIAMRDAIVNKDTGSLYAAKTQSTAILDQNKLDLLKNSKLGGFVATTNSLRELGGEQYAQNWMANEVFGKSGIAEGLRDFTKGWGMEFRTQTSEGRGKGVLTFNDLAEDLKQRGITDPLQQKAIMQQRVKDIDDITKPDVSDAIKVNLAKSAFSSGNNGFLSKLNMDSFDERGRPIHGMNAVFQKWTSPEVSREMERLGRNDPALWKQYTDWVKTTWSTELMPRDLAQLSQYQKDPNIRIGWDTENKRFTVEKTAVPALQGKFREGLGGEGRNSSELVANQRQFEDVTRAMNRINSGLYNLRHVAAMENPKDPTATDAFLLRTIAQATSPEVIQNINSLPGDLMRKIALGAQNANRK